MHQRLEEQEECALEMRETHSSLQQDIAQITKRLRKVFSKLQNAKQELHEVGLLLIIKTAIKLKNVVPWLLKYFFKWKSHLDSISQIGSYVFR